ncbi:MULTISPECIES: hypothetical protein [Pantoea]|uniref:DUF1120 domain-containing protein n=1 Tax=Candidatus Pantoea gossypiicola TaxID=2608008 RepID=A0AB34CJW7_9GAMM|nr:MULTISPECIES: hypothetical protein [Pantoea]KAA5928920.1 hypothetical protein F3I59_11885 [Pantoea sp. VH_8]KAA5934812.1 hypothetical protein F3I58_10780 [Pantoea sp. VH_4]KAA5986067.1 hypothetical protein F3I49_10945 [Pantoea sp. M_4]KAA6124342.1 hypothetical protein F3I20_12535 [Pantoea gossypiicola]
MKQQSILSLLLAISGLFTATILHAECEVQLSEPHINYGEMTRGELLSRPGNALSAAELRMGDERESEITVICDRPTPLTLTFTGPPKDNQNYQFGEQGRATLTLHDVTIDDRPVMIESAGNEAAKMAFTASNPMRFRKEGQIVSGSTLRAKVTIATWLPSSATRVSDRQHWQLNGSFLVSSDG